MTTSTRPPLDELIDEAAEHYPEFTPKELAEKFRERARRHHAEADALRRYGESKRS